MTLIYFILILGIIVFVHELGHFLAAKIFKVHVYEFSLGMGPRILGTKPVKGKTTYNLRLFPIGGFVSLAGEDPTEEENIKEEIKKENLLYNKPIWQRSIIMIAGVFNNFLLAVILLLGIAIFHGAPNMKTVIQKLDLEYPMYKAGLRENDRILKINNYKISSLDDIMLHLNLNNSKDKELNIEVLRNKEKLTFKVKPLLVNIDKDGNEVKEKGIDTKEVYRYGIVFEPRINRSLGAIIKYPFIKVKALVKQMVVVLGLLITGKLSLSTLSGPVGIYGVVGTVTKSNVLLNIASLTAVFCVNVGFLNILPFPAFDGGHVFFLLIEKIRGKKLNPKLLNAINMTGFALLMIFMLLITISDILKIRI